MSGYRCQYWQSYLSSRADASLRDRAREAAALAVRSRFAESNIMAVSDSSPLGRRIRLGVIGGGGNALIGPVHRIAARLDDRFEISAGVLSSDPVRSVADAIKLNIPRGYPDVPTMIAEEASRPDGIDAVSGRPSRAPASSSHSSSTPTLALVHRPSSQSRLISRSGNERT